MHTHITYTHTHTFQRGFESFPGESWHYPDKRNLLFSHFHTLENDHAHTHTHTHSFAHTHTPSCIFTQLHSIVYILNWLISSARFKVLQKSPPSPAPRVQQLLLKCPWERYFIQRVHNTRRSSPVTESQRWSEATGQVNGAFRWSDKRATSCFTPPSGPVSCLLSAPPKCLCSLECSKKKKKKNVRGNIWPHTSYTHSLCFNIELPFYNCLELFLFFFRHKHDLWLRSFKSDCCLDSLLLVWH